MSLLNSCRFFSASSYPIRMYHVILKGNIKSIEKPQHFTRRKMFGALICISII